MESQDLTKLDDVAFIEERHKTRDLLELSPDDDDLQRRYEAIDAEFMRRASIAWATS